MNSAARILQATAWYPPFGIGGTETYVEGLVAGLARRGFESRILLPRPARAPPRYEHAGAFAFTYPVNDLQTSAEGRGAPHEGFESFVDLLKANRGAIYHQH